MTTIFSPDKFAPVEHFSREVQIDRDEFLRQLPGAIEPHTFTLEGDFVKIPEAGGVVVIRLASLPNEQLGQLDLPMMKLDFAFFGLSQGEIDAFMKTYEERTFRGAGGM